MPHTNYIADHEFSSLRGVPLGDYLNPVFIETGTNTGLGVKEAISHGFKKIISIDIEERYIAAAREEFTSDKYPDVEFEFVEGSSADVLGDIISNLNEKITFFLDGHGCGKNPLGAELEAIKNHPIKDHTILVDDVRMLGHNHGYFGEFWGEDTRRDIIIKAVMEVNSDYKISYHCTPNGINDLMVAKID